MPISYAGAIIYGVSIIILALAEVGLISSPEKFSALFPIVVDSILIIVLIISPIVFRRLGTKLTDTLVDISGDPDKFIAELKKQNAILLLIRFLVVFLLGILVLIVLPIWATLVLSCNNARYMISSWYGKSM